MHLDVKFGQNRRIEQSRPHFQQDPGGLQVAHFDTIPQHCFVVDYGPHTRQHQAQHVLEFAQKVTSARGAGVDE